MKLHYFPDTDSLYIELKDEPSVDSREIAPGFAADYNEKGQIVGFDIDLASKKVDLSSFAIEQFLPAKEVWKKRA